MKPTGLYYNYPSEAYHADVPPHGLEGSHRAALTQSIAKVLCTQSPAHARLASGWYRRQIGLPDREPTTAMRFGTMVHELVLRPGGSRDMYAPFDGDNRTREGKAASQAILQSGLLPLRSAEYDRLMRTVDAAKLELKLALDIDVETLPDPAFEVSAYWTEDNVACRGRFDIYLPDRNLIVDIKTAHDANQTEQSVHHIKYGYDIQHAAYCSAIKALGMSDPDMAFVMVETEAPYATSTVRHGSQLRKHGLSRWRRAKALWAQATANDEWPAYSAPGLVIDLGCPHWAVLAEGL